MIISISGLIGSGKDTVANFLVEKYGFHRESWAGTLKDAVSSIFGWDRILLEGTTEESRLWRETVDEWWSNKLGMTITPRFVLQNFGTNVCRNNFHDNIWVASLENKLRKTTKNIVISDSRFPNEVESVKKLNGLAWRIKRGPDPEWVEEIKTLKSLDEFKSRYPDIHASEYASVNLAYDNVIYNNYTIHKLHDTISNLVEYHLASK